MKRDRFVFQLPERSAATHRSRGRSLLRAAALCSVVAISISIVATSPCAGQSTRPVERFPVARSAGEPHVHGDSVYLPTSYTGPLAGAFALIHKTTGEPKSGVPRVDGEVFAIAPDGAGGHFIGGNFSRVGGYARANIAHILADGRVSPWSPNADGQVNELLIIGKELYVGGAFQNIGGQSRERLAALDLVSGDATPWDPGYTSAPVRALAVSGSTLYVGGEFIWVGGENYPYLGAYDLTTGNILSWNPSLSGGGWVEDILVAEGTVFIGGQFLALQNHTVFRNHLAALADDTSAVTILDWDPSPNNRVNSLAISGNTLFVGGNFPMIGGLVRNYLAAVDATSGDILDWSPAPGRYVNDTVVEGDNLFAGGQFPTIGGARRSYLAALDTTVESNNALPWDPSASGYVNVLVSSGDNIAAGGSFNSVGGLVPSTSTSVSIAQIDIPSGQRSTLAVEVARGTATPKANVMVFDPPTMYVGGYFSTINGTPRDNIGAIDLTTETVLDWDPDSSNEVLCLLRTGSTIYAGGRFSTIGGASRRYVAALDTTIPTSNALPWDPSPSWDVRSMVFRGSNILAGGYFLNFGDPPVDRQRLAEIDPAGGLTVWDPTAGFAVQRLELFGSTVYVGGSFTTIGGASRQGIAALDPGGSVIVGFDAGVVQGSVNDIEETGGLLFLAGTFTSIGGSARSRVAAVSATTGDLDPWNPQPVGASAAWVEKSGELVFVSGNFAEIGGEPRSGFAAFCLLEAPTGLLAIPGTGTQVNLLWDPVFGAVTYTVYRSRSSGGPWNEIGSTPDTGFTDLNADGGITFYYTVAAAGNDCESDFAAQAVAETHGTCQMEPDFDGTIYALQTTNPFCAIEVGWRAASALCGGPASYSVYRSTLPEFIPGPGNRIASGLTGTTFTDNTAGLSSGTTHYYVVRATDTATGAFEENSIAMPVTLGACSSTPAAPVQVFSTLATNERVQLEWLNPENPYALTHVCWRADAYPTAPEDGVCVDLAGTPDTYGTTVHDTSSAGGIANDTTYFYGVWVNAASDGSGPWSSGKFSSGRPFNTSESAKWAYTTGATALAPSGIIPGDFYFMVSNDRILHSNVAGPTGGTWPPGWRPVAMNAPAQGRPTIVDFGTPTVPDASGATTVAFVGSQDGRVYAFDAETSAELWASPVLGDAIQGSPGGVFQAYGAAFDLVLVGTRTSTGPSKLYALNLLDGTVAWSFDNGGGSVSADAIGIISSQVWVDQINSTLFFTSRARSGGSDQTVWCVDFTASSATHRWSAAVGSIDAAPTLWNGVVYVGDINGVVHAFDADSTGTNVSPLWSYISGDGAVKGFVWADNQPSGVVLFFSTDSGVNAITDVGAAVSGWSPPSVPGASPVFVIGNDLFVGTSGGNGSLLRINKFTGAQLGSVGLGDPSVPKSVGNPTYDYLNDMIVVGCGTGEVFGVVADF